MASLTPTIRFTRSAVSPTREPVRDEWSVTLLRAAGTGTGFAQAEKAVPGQVRRAATVVLHSWGVQSLVESASLVLSELVTNAFQHADGDRVIVRLIRTGFSVRIEVGGPGTRPPELRRAADLDEGGRGLVLVDALAEDWGYSEERSTFWCTLRVPVEGATS